MASLPTYRQPNLVLDETEPGDLVLLGARPRQGKTLLGLELAVETLKAGGQAAFFSLEFDNQDVLRCLETLGEDPGRIRQRFLIDTCDDIHADHIMERLSDAPRGTVVVIDYLQQLDQRRENPSVMEQVLHLGDFAQHRGLIMIFLSQIHRSFDSTTKKMPDSNDVHLPNPLDLSLFHKQCFLHEGEISFGSAV